jgi:F0F1-type ATP synthase membrane subunit b/b'
MSDGTENTKEITELDKTQQLREHVEMCAEAILEHTAGLEDMKEDLIASIVEGYEAKVEEMITERVDKRVEIILKKHGLI